jgi:hypothetical protein
MRRPLNAEGPRWAGLGASEDQAVIYCSGGVRKEGLIPLGAFAL